MHTIPEEISKSRYAVHRTYIVQFKAQLVAACQQPGASVAALAREHGKTPMCCIAGSRSIVRACINATWKEMAQLQPPPSAPATKGQPRRQPLPAELPRKIIHHDPISTTCSCGCQLKRIGEDIAEKLDYEPGVFTVERHIRSKWACTQCAGQVFSDTTIGCLIADCCSKALGGKLSSLESRRTLL